MKKLSNEEAFEKILKKHGNKYLYPNFNYKGYRNKILIICEKHGEFNQAYGDHIIGCGCQLCGGVAKIDTKSFIKKSEIIHNYFYDYSKSKFLGYKNPIKIICPIHGEFIQKPHYHLKGRGCSKCGREKTIKSHSYTQDIFLSMAADIHKNKYSYPENYEHGYKNLKIICPIHGEFRQIPTSHLKGNGCQECGKIGYNSDEFIELVKSKHNNKYDYSKSIYNGTKDKINIICPEHGEFTQIAGDHIQGHGCKLCGDKYGIKESRWLDSLNIKSRQVRIGKYIVDGYDPETNTIYEFNGDFWHGNPNKYKKDDINPICGKTFGYLLQKTIEKEKKLKELGYNIVSIWESEY